MMQSIFNGVSGVKTHSFGMDILANNIANINTVGYKAAVPEFKDVYYQTAANSSISSLGANQMGVATTGVSSAFSKKQGALVISDRDFDVAIEGRGFFGVNDVDGNTYYTRNGQFAIDSNFRLVDNYSRPVLGTMNKDILEQAMSPAVSDMFGATSTNKAYLMASEKRTLAISDKQEPIFLPSTLYMPAQPTTKVSIKANLDNTIKIHKTTQPLNDVDLVLNDGKSRFSASNLEPNSSVQIRLARGGGYEIHEAKSDEFGNLDYEIDGNVSDFQATITSESKSPVKNIIETKIFSGDGSKKRILIEITPEENVNFKAKATLFDAKNNILAIKEGKIEFNSDGSLKRNDITELGGIELDLGTAKGANSSGFDGLTSIDNLSSDKQITQNGNPMGVLRHYDIDENGNILANFTNGKSRAIAKLAVFNFQNEQGLRKIGESEFACTADSGKPQYFYNESGENLLGGVLKSHYLEQSNVDFASELSSVVVFQKAYEANAKSITTADAMLKRAIEMKK